MKAARMLGIVGVAVGVVLAGLAGQARGTTWYVDANGGADFNSIQAALDDPCTVDGDEIEVAPGTYYEAINFSGKAVRLYSSGGPNDTTIDGTGNYHVVKCVSGEDANTILEGFTITGGNANGTGAEQYGGGMYNYVDSSPTVTNCTFIGNSAVYGAGMYCDLSSPTVTNCIFSDNTAANYGGGMYNYDNSNPNVTNCIFSDNTAANDGGGMYNYLSSGPTVTNCIFSGNSATDRGGGMYNYDNSNPNVTNCIFTDNTAANYGGGMSNGQNSNTMVTNCIFHGNEATTNGGGMYNYDNSNPILTNCILWGNVNGQIAGNWGTVNYSCLQGSLPPSGTGNIDADPLFVDAGGGNLRVKVGSPCVDAGDNNSVPAGVTTDLDGNPRVVDGDWNGTDIVDMGAYELPPPHIHNITQNTWYGTIQGAIDDANDDDEIEVGPGTYYGAIDFLGKAVRLYSNGGPKVTTIDVSGLNWSVVTCNSGEGPNTILEGFTITGGKGKTVGGYKFGGGMYNLNSSPTVKDCNITTNSVTGDGGGMYNDNSSPTVTNCSFAGNSSVYAGGGMHNRNNSNPSVTNCTFMGNAAGGDFGGGGMLNYSSNATVTNCTFSDNTTTANGGGMCNRSCSPTVANCSFAGNSSKYAGGGMYNRSNSNPSVTNCTFTGNAAGGDYGGGGMLNYSSNPTVTNCTFTDNTTSAKGGGMYNLSCSPTVTNCILWGNTAATGPQIYGSAVVEYSDVEGGWGGADGNNINAHPLFADAAGGNLRLRACSPCVDAGNNNSVPADSADLDGDGNTVEPTPFDLGGNPRFVDDEGIVDSGAGTAPLVDMGAHERQMNTPILPDIYNITKDANYCSIQLAIEDANDGDVIEVGTARYYETIDFKGKAIRLRSADPNDPNVVAATVIDATGLGSSGVICASGEGPNTILEGFTITGGKGKTVGPYKFGGGMYNSGSSPTVKDCNFSANSVTGDGGGMYNDNSSPTVTNCSFAGNSSIYAGGGMHNRNNSNPSVTNCTFMGNAAGGDFGGGGMLNYSSNATVTNCTFSDNTTTANGGGMCNRSCSPTVANCSFAGNSSKYAGGGMYNRSNSNPSVTNCTFTGNAAGGDYGGGGMLNYSSNPTVTNCTFTDNTTSAKGGGLYNLSCSPTVTNCILWGNTAATGPQIYGSAVVEYSDVEGGHSGTGNIDAAPIFLNMYDGNLRLGVRSPCVDAGNNADVPADANMDLDGNPRFVDDANVGDTGAGTAPIVDMGAYERQTDSAPGVNNAGTWYWTISEAMDEAVAGDVIEVGPETLSEGVDFNGLAITLRSTDPNDPNVVGVTIIDATGLGSSAVICADGEGPNTILAGFTIIGGHATNGGGMYCENSDPTVVNCRFSYNVADCNGGGMYCENSSPTVSNCNFSYNIADCNGGGMYCENSSPTVTGCVFYRNSTSDGQDYKYPQGESELHGRHGGHAGHGGGMYNDYSSPIVSSCEFIENRTGSGGNGENGDSEWCRNGGWGGDGGDAGWGAGMYNYLSGPTITNCLFRLNETGAGGTPGHAADAGDCLFDCTRPGNGGDGGNGGHGAGICNYDSSPIISYCEFSENKSGNGANGGYGGDIKDVLSCAYVQQGCGGRGGAGGDGAAMYNIGSSPAVTNCTFKANVGGDGGDGGVAGMGGCGLWPSPVTGGIAGDGGDGAAMYNIVSSPKVTGCKFEDNKSGDGGDGGDSMPCVCDIPCDYPRGSEGGDGGDGAGLYNSGSYPDVTNCSFTANWTGAGGAGGSGSPPGASGTRGAGAGIYDSNSSPTVTNCILWGDAPDEIVDDPCSTSVVNYSDVQGGYDGTGNIYAYPYFVHAAGGNLRLQSMSPCIDAGDNVSVPNDIGDLDNDSNTTEPLPWDLDGRARFGDGDCNGSDIVDMGAYEFSTADIGDFDDDCAVDFVDYAILSDYWLMDEPSVDIAPQPAGDGIIDERDLDILCENWLAGK